MVTITLLPTFIFVQITKHYKDLLLRLSCHAQLDSAHEASLEPGSMAEGRPFYLTLWLESCRGVIGYHLQIPRSEKPDPSFIDIKLSKDLLIFLE